MTNDLRTQEEYIAFEVATAAASQAINKFVAEKLDDPNNNPVSYALACGLQAAEIAFVIGMTSDRTRNEMIGMIDTLAMDMRERLLYLLKFSTTADEAVERQVAANA